MMIVARWLRERGDEGRVFPLPSPDAIHQIFASIEAEGTLPAAYESARVETAAP